MGRPRKTETIEETPPKREVARKLLLVCSTCDHEVEVNGVTSDPESWPQHRCKTTNRPAPFTQWNEPRKLTVKPMDLSGLY